MKRAILLAAAIAGAASLAAVVAGAQGRGAPAIRMQTLSVYDILYVLTGGGGNTLALMRDDGVVLIDTKNPGSGKALQENIESVSDKPVTTIINTHAHADHTGSNPEFPSAVQIIAQEHTKANMQKMDAFKGPNARFLPNKTVADRMTLFDGPDRLELYYFGRGHTDGDLIVVFPEKRVAYFGDLFPAKAAPVIDVANGGSGVEFPKTLARAIAEIKGIARVVTGHDNSIAVMANAASGSAIFANPRPMAWKDLEEYADFNRDFLAAVQEAMKAGKSAADAAASLQLPERYKDYNMQNARANVEAIYKELGK
jgi:glyoxylase-like metal-dependent hydrolase (beta-lactamase superfamily II)